MGGREGTKEFGEGSLEGKLEMDFSSYSWDQKLSYLNIGEKCERATLK